MKDGIHGYWIKTYNGTKIDINTGKPVKVYKCDCSVCGWHTGNQGTRFKYCPMCGAEMDADEHPKGEQE